jgi:short-subunit dehydrogenase
MVTGASSGIGRAFAERLARDQYDLILVARGRERLESLAAELRRARNVDVEVLPADLADSAGLAAVEARLGTETLDLLVNNAGFGSFGRFHTLAREGEQAQIRLNVLALVTLTHAALPAMVERGRGAVINVSSLGGEAPLPYSATYGATKAFVTSFTLALAEELRGSGVRLQALLPGFTRTEFQERAGIDSARLPSLVWLDAGEVAEASLAALGRGQVVCVPGAAYRLFAGAQRLIPRGVLGRITAGLTGRQL